MSESIQLSIRWWFAWVLLIISVVNWPLSTVWYASGEPPTVLALSWIAIILTALDIINTVDVRRKQMKQEKGE